jgi:hypothetical protein
MGVVFNHSRAAFRQPVARMMLLWRDKWRGLPPAWLYSFNKSSAAATIKIALDSSCGNQRDDLALLAKQASASVVLDLF